VVKEVLQNFKVGIPLNASGLLFGVVLALLLNMLIMLPFRLMRSGRRAEQY
ncbi:MAG: DUF2937 family protein, partial [Gammaproteobacteria bacterium]|nr:DUF2937 family protein [Gammaproteobacteria bacterium]